jgi:hypothetical protein
MRRIYILLLVALLLGTTTHAQDAKSLGIAMTDIDKALVAKDSIVLKRLLNGNLSYGHSNGWIETRTDVINDLYNGKLTYKSITPKAQAVTVSIEGSTAAVRYVADVDILYGGKPMQMQLNVLQVWVWMGNHWELFARQSVKV